MRIAEVLNWSFGEKLVLYKANPDEVDDRPTMLALNGKFWYLCHKEFVKELAMNGDCTELEDGTIIAVAEDGGIEPLHHQEQKEIDLFVTNKCNSNCIMCPVSEYVRKKNESWHMRWIENYIGVLPDDTPYINVTGGEPTLALDNFFRVMSLLKDKFQHSDFQILSNGRAFSDLDFLDAALKHIPMGSRFAIPLHCSIGWVHDEITQSNGSFLQTSVGIRNLLKRGQKVEIRVVVSRKNFQHLCQTAQYIAKKFHGVFCVNFIAMEMMGNAAINREKLWIDFDEAFCAARPAIDLLVKEGIDVQLYNFPLCAVSRGYWQLAAKSISDYKIRYMEECGECSVKGICGGLFYSTKQIMKPKVRPIMK